MAKKRRRGKGEGTIARRADGRWAARLDAGYRDGKRVRIWLYGKTRAEVAEKLSDALHDHHRGLLPPPARLTVAQYLERWLTDHVTPTRRARTVESYEQMIRCHVVPTLGRVPLQKLTPPQVQHWLNDLRSSGLSPRTCQYARAILRSALSQALRWGVVVRNVATLVTPPSGPAYEVRFLEPDQARTLLATASTHRLSAFVVLALTLGLRRGEILGLRWEAVDLDGATLRVRVALQRVGGTLQLVETKSKRARRSLTMPDMAITALRAHRVQQLEERLAAGQHWQEHGLVFTTRKGTPLEPSSATRWFHRVLEQAALPRIRPHDLRHACASFLLAEGVDVRTIMELLGHSQITLTLNTYSHVLPALTQDAAKKIDGLLSSGMKSPKGKH